MIRGHICCGKEDVSRKKIGSTHPVMPTSNCCIRAHSEHSQINYQQQKTDNANMLLNSRHLAQSQQLAELKGQMNRAALYSQKGICPYVFVWKTRGLSQTILSFSRSLFPFFK